MKTPEEAARLLAHAINEWGGCFDCCTDGRAALDQLRPNDDPNAPNDERIEAALLDLVKAAQAETLAEFTVEADAGNPYYPLRRLVGPWEPDADPNSDPQ